MKKEGKKYVGVLYAGILLATKGSKSEIEVLEFNCRFGDPETQSILPLLDSDLVDICEACVDGKLSELSIKWKPSMKAATVVLASKGYPDAYEKGKEIIIKDIQHQNVVVFHAGTSFNKDGKLITSGGRVLAVTAWASELKEAVTQCYITIKESIEYEGMYYRKDIAHRAFHSIS